MFNYKELLRPRSFLPLVVSATVIFFVSSWSLKLWVCGIFLFTLFSLFMASESLATNYIGLCLISLALLFSGYSRTFFLVAAEALVACLQVNELQIKGEFLKVRQKVFSAGITIFLLLALQNLLQFQPDSYEGLYYSFLFFKLLSWHQEGKGESGYQFIFLGAVLLTVPLEHFVFAKPFFLAFTVAATLQKRLDFTLFLFWALLLAYDPTWVFLGIPVLIGLAFRGFSMIALVFILAFVSAFLPMSLSTPEMYYTSLLMVLMIGRAIAGVDVSFQKNAENFVGLSSMALTTLAAGIYYSSFFEEKIFVLDPESWARPPLLILSFLAFVFSMKAWPRIVSAVELSGIWQGITGVIAFSPRNSLGGKMMPESSSPMMASTFEIFLEDHFVQTMIWLALSALAIWGVRWAIA